MLSSVGLSPLAHLPLSLPSFLPHPPGERRKKPFNILFFSLLLLLLYIRLFLFSPSYPLLVFFLFLFLLISLTLLGEFGSEIALFVVVESWL